MDLVYTVISGTNRADSNSDKIARIYYDLLCRKGLRVRFFPLRDITMLERNEAFQVMEQEMLLPASKFIFVVPEYNGSIPGILKLMLDMSDYKKTWKGKKALLTGLSLGRAGNLRGMEHLTGILHFMQVVVHPNKLPISSVHKLMNGEGALQDTATLQAMEQQLDEFVAF